MTTKPLEPEDPMALVGVGLERGPEAEALTEMAWCFVEEYARMGWSGERILRLFRNPFYRGPHQILRMKGEDFVRGLIQIVEQTRAQVRSQGGR
ncbi:hypothetical protein LCGC14_1453070 [marine sediment metagenome]|uniref:Uncharacterized protein n=1 Tax=marine sediment metagenome TaxID=412755 RepID=A0A0F9JH89_9ZZZZ